MRTPSSLFRQLVLDVLHELAQWIREEGRFEFQWTIRVAGLTFTATGDCKMDIKDTDAPCQVVLTLAPVDAKGKPAKVDGAPTYALDSNANCSIASVAPDGLTAVINVGDTPSATQVQITADADLGPGVTTLNGVFVINVIPGDAVDLGVTGTVQQTPT